MLIRKVMFREGFVSGILYEAIGPCRENKEMDQQSIIFGEHIFKPELECIAVLVHYLGSSVQKKELVVKMIQCDFHLDAIEKVKAFSDGQYLEFISHINATFLNSKNDAFVGQVLLDEFKEHCTCCCK